MSAQACRAAWLTNAERPSANDLDAAFPNGACELFSLSEPERSCIAPRELVARVLTSPRDYDATIGEILTAKLTDCYRSGLSVIRQGASDDDILGTIGALLAAEGNDGLVGAVVLPAERIREIGEEAKHFCLYDTDSPVNTNHGDVVGTFSRDLSRSAWDKEMSRRRRALRDVLAENIVHAVQPPDLLAALRQSGI